MKSTATLLNVARGNDGYSPRLLLPWINTTSALFYEITETPGQKQNLSPAIYVINWILTNLPRRA